jgi:hypothetical protein
MAALVFLAALLAVSWRTPDDSRQLAAVDGLAPVSSVFPDAVYALETRLSADPYIAELWVDIGPTARPYHGVLVLTRNGELVLREEFVVSLDPLSGTDVTGEGDPDLIVEEYSGGAHCCGGTYILNLSADVRRIRIPCPPRGNASRLGPDPGGASGFHDLDGDGMFEFVTWDDSFAYEFDSYANSPGVPVALRYDPASGYVPVNGLLRHTYEQAIVAQLEQMWASSQVLANAAVAAPAVTQLVLLYLYLGRSAEAWEALYRFYQFPDVEDLRTHIAGIVYGSPCFQPEAGASGTDPRGVGGPG